MSSAAYNEYAWLVSNTQGDLDQAEVYAKKAVAYSAISGGSQGGLIDTLAYVYAAQGKWDKAIATANLAVQLEPNEPDIAENAKDIHKRAEDAKNAPPEKKDAKDSSPKPDGAKETTEKSTSDSPFHEERPVRVERLPPPPVLISR